MKTLYFLRHGKSDWDAAYGDDHERPLAKRGRKAAKQLGKLLTDWKQQPDRIVTSSAVRALQTLDYARKAGGWQVPERVTEALYLAEPEAVLAEIHAEPDTAERLLLVGHEPTWSETISRLIGGGDVRVPTAAVARVDLDVEAWRDIQFGDGQLIWLLPPRLLEGKA